MKKFFLLFYFSVSVLAYSQQDRAKADSIIAFAKKHLGIKYRYAECTPKRGFDCSGFVFYVFGNFNIKVPRASMDYEKTGKLIRIDSCKTGDIIVFTGTNSKNKAPGHVGIIVSNTSEGVVFIHSSSGHKRIGVILTNFTQSPYYQKRFIKVARLKAVY
jgi:lipoprotein Spr